MKKLYEKNEVLFAVLWILVYCLVTIPIRGEWGDESPWMLAALAAIAAGITVFVKSGHLEQKYGLSRWPKDSKRYFWFIPMWILSTGNLWGGIMVRYQGIDLVCAVLSMLLIGYVEEMLFRGFLFKALLKKDGVKPAVIISAVTFGIGHIVNLFNGSGRELASSLIQIVFAVLVGFVLVWIFYHGKSLIPCILFHSVNNALKVFAVEGSFSPQTEMILNLAVIVVLLGGYAAYLVRTFPIREKRSR